MDRGLTKGRCEISAFQMPYDGHYEEGSGFNDMPSPIALQGYAASSTNPAASSTKPPGQDLPANARLIMPGEVWGFWPDDIPSPVRFCFYYKDYWAICRVCEEIGKCKCSSIETVMEHIDSNSHKKRWGWQDDMRKDAEKKASQHDEWCARNNRERQPPFGELAQQQFPPPQQAAQNHFSTGHPVGQPD